MHWIGNARLDRYVLRAVKQTPHTGCRPITATTQFLLKVDGLVAGGQCYPDENDVYVSLLRLMGAGLVERYIDVPTGGIRYRACVYPRARTIEKRKR